MIRRSECVTRNPEVTPKTVQFLFGAYLAAEIGRSSPIRSQKAP
jgi:hypothetical protein